MNPAIPELIGGLIAGACLAAGSLGMKAAFSHNGKPKVCEQHGELLAVTRETKVLVVEMHNDIKEIFPRLNKLEANVEVLKARHEDDGR